MALAHSLVSVLALLATPSAAWNDCDKVPSDARGPFKVASSQNLSFAGKPVYVHYPLGSPPDSATGWPAVIFHHGMTLGWEYYASHIERFASHGMVVAFPFIESPEKDDGVVPVTETDAGAIYAAAGLLKGIANGTFAKLEGMEGNIDMDTLAVAGHSMGGENTIRAAAGVRVPKGFEAFKHGQIKVAVAQHPSLCTFPPPYPYTINKAEIDASSRNSTLILFTAENDRAFLPGTPSKEHSCWQAATGTAQFVSVKKEVCNTYPPCSSMPKAGGCSLKVGFVGDGHMCGCDAPGLDTWTSPELKWVTTALRLYLHHGGNSAKDNVCKDILWGSGADSLRQDSNMLTVEMHGPQPSEVIV